MRISSLFTYLILTLAVVACDAGQNAQASNSDSSKRTHRTKKAHRSKHVNASKAETAEDINDEPKVQTNGSLPQGFVYVKDVIPDVIEELRYNTSNNFTGSHVDGYEANRAILTVEAAKALKGAADELRSKGYVIKIFDAYRPQSAVNNFVRWSLSADERTKADYYPTLSKKSLFGPYIARKSGHSRGSTVDMTICYKDSGKEVDMGGHFDFFGQASHPTFTGKYPLGEVTAAHKQQRMMLRGVMTRHGFKGIVNEWWHFVLKNEPHPNTYYNFPVK